MAGKYKPQVGDWVVFNKKHVRFVLLDPNHPRYHPISFYPKDMYDGDMPWKVENIDRRSAVPVITLSFPSPMASPGCTDVLCMHLPEDSELHLLPATKQDFDRKILDLLDQNVRNEILVHYLEQEQAGILFESRVPSDA